MHIQSDIVKKNELKKAIIMWLTDIYNGNHALIDHTEKNKIKFIMIIFQKIYMILQNVIVLYH